MTNPDWTDPIDWEDHGFVTLLGDEEMAGTLVSRYTSDDGTKWVIAELVDGRRVQIEPDKWRDA